MKVSRHAKQRMKERCGFNGKAQERMARKALTDGITHAQTKGRLNKRIYGDNAYIFCGETLVTVIPVPANIKKDMEKMIRR